LGKLRDLVGVEEALVADRASHSLMPRHRGSGPGRRLGGREVSSVRDQRLRIFGDRVELVRPKVTSEARTTAIPLADIDYVSVKRFLMVRFDLVIVPKSGAVIRIETTCTK
jgi:hypothetical protein